MFTSIKKGSGAEQPARVKFLRKALVPKSDKQFEEFKNSCEVLISTPLKLAQLCQKFKMDGLKHLVIDEADKMFEMGFLEQIDSILGNCKDNHKIAKFMFSATMQPAIEDIVKNVMNNDPLKVQIGLRNTSSKSVTSKLLYCGLEENKIRTLR